MYFYTPKYGTAAGAEKLFTGVHFGTNTAGITGNTIQLITTDTRIITVYVTPNGTGATTENDTDTPTFAIGGSTSATATELAKCLNGHSQLTATSVSNVVTITQVQVGSKGNTPITATENIISHTLKS